MVTVALDSYMFIGLIQGESAAIKKMFSDLGRGRLSAVASSLVLAEVKYRIGRELGEDRAVEACVFVRAISNLSLVDVTPEIAEAAASLRLRYYSPKSQLSFADCIHAATALSKNCDFLATGDEDFSAIKELKTELVKER